MSAFTGKRAPALIEVVNVRKSYRQGGLFGGKNKVDVINGVDLRVEAGRCLGLLGASGCGKSTVGRLILGLEYPDSGRILWKGGDINAFGGEERRLWRRNNQVVFQNSHGAVNPGLPAWKIVAEPLMNYGTPKGELRGRAESLIRDVGLPGDCLDKKPHQFSGGELQRLCIARALALAPEFILLDESVSSLDMANQSVILELLADLKNRTGAAFLFISHDLRVLLNISDSLAVMDEGRITSSWDDIADLEKEGVQYDPTLARLVEAVLTAEPPEAHEAHGGGVPLEGAGI
ncbi:MAG: ATP-binding cassette domain-containing protein [Deltaproteobacteria bacterium]|jgi:nickel transport system ATP-binding protein|nr:ATP-binding cassette domain-containing protein [Deltaproteobacteria bacterium]